MPTTPGIPLEPAHTNIEGKLGPLLLRRDGRVPRWCPWVFDVLLGGGAAAVYLAGDRQMAGLIGLGAAIVCPVLHVLSRTRYLFHERGLRVSSARGVRDFLYAEITSMRFRIVRQYINYIHAGTSAFMHLTDAAGRKCAVCTTYREKQVGFVRRRFEADTVLDSMRELISDHIVAGMTDRILAGESVDWCGQAKLSEAGITPARGPCAGHLVPYRHIQGVRMHNRKFEVLRLGDRHPFLRLDPGAENFGPAAKLLGRLAESSGAAQDDSTGAVSEQRRRAA